MMKLIEQWSPAIALMAVIYFASDLPASRIPELPKGDDMLKKGGHALGYGLLALAYLRGLGRSTKNKMFLSALMTALFAISDEWHQGSTPGRTPSWRDVGFDLMGAAVALGVYKASELVRRLIHHHFL
jgi:VanZ family protein